MADRPPRDRRHADAEAVVRGYESISLRGRPVVLIAAGVVIVLVVLMAGVWSFERAIGRPTSNVEGPSAQNTALSAPPLQPQRDYASVDAWDVRKMRDAENTVFERLGWTPRPDGTGVRVPTALVDRLRDRQNTAATTQKGGG